MSINRWQAWIRLLLVILPIGGGFTGFSITLPQLLRPRSLEPVYFLLIIGFLLLYAFVIISGVVYVENEKRVWPLLVTYAIQTPWFSSPYLAYKFTAGFQVTIGMIGRNFQFGIMLGSDWQLNLLQHNPYGAGINMFALVITILLAHRLVYSKRHNIGDL